MTTRDLERLLGAAGATASKVATITGQLRETGRLPKAGRGLNAPCITARHAATVLATVAGTARANEAGRRVEKLERLASNAAPAGASFLDRMAALLQDPELVKGIGEVRVSRTISRATILHRDGTFEEFVGGRQYDLDEQFRSVGELPGGLLTKVALLLQHPGKKKRRRRVQADAN